ncbi:MAG: hypothetical protein HZR80_18640 [Candidatus Heimdallarchaeota archaeon]
MVKEIIFRTEIEFKGSDKEFIEFSRQLVALDKTAIRIEWPPNHLAGCNMFANFKYYDKQFIEKLIKDLDPIKLKDIYGGIRNPHIHLEDFNVVFLKPESFKQVLDYAVTKLTKEFTDFDHVKVMGAMNKLTKHATKL